MADMLIYIKIVRAALTAWNGYMLNRIRWGLERPVIEIKTISRIISKVN